MPRSGTNTKGMARIVADNRSKYRVALSRRELESIESLAWTAMREFGYEPDLAHEQTHLSRWSLALRCAKDGVQLARRGAAKRGWMRALRFHAQHRAVSKI